MYCKKCGKESSDGSKFCVYCGAKFENYENTAFKVSNSQNYYSNYQPQFNSANYGQPNSSFTQQQSFMTKKKKRYKKSVIITIFVVIAMLFICVFGFTVAKVVKYQRAAEAVNNIEIPETPDLDLDANFNSSFFGIINGNNYTNSYADLNLTVPSDEWKMLTRQEIYDHQKSLGVNVLLDEENQESYVDNGYSVEYYDMIMINTSNNSNVQVVLVDNKENSDLTINDYFESIEYQLSENFDNATFESAGIMTIGDNYYSVKQGSATYEGVGVTQYYAGANVGNDFVFIISTFGEGDQESFLEFFDSIVVE